MTYQDLKTKLEKLTPEQLAMDVTLHLTKDDECFMLDDLTTIETDTLDSDHPVLTLTLETNIL